MPQEAVARVPVPLDSVVPVSELLGALLGHRQRFSAIRGRGQVSLTEFLACGGAELSATPEAPTPTPEAWLSARESEVEV